MFESVELLSGFLKDAGYFIDPVMTQVIFLADKLNKPILLEGPAGSGKTQLALSVAAAGKTHVERLQCYRGVTEAQAIGSFDASLQRLYLEFTKQAHGDWQSIKESLVGRDFFRAGPLMRALECERPCVLLIDELDKVDDGFEAMLLEVLSAWQMSIPEFGTVRARSIPFVVLTSNEERRLGEAIATRWIQTPKGIMLLQMVPGDLESGGIYVLDRLRLIWYLLTFEARDCDFTQEQFDRVYSEYKLFHYVEQPGLLLDRAPAAIA